MFELGSWYLDTTSRFSRFCWMWCLGYHGFEAITRLSTGRSGMQTYATVQLHTLCPLMSPGIPPSYSSRPLRSWISFRHFHPVPRKLAQVEAPRHLPKNTLTYTRRHVPGAMLMHSMSPKWKMVSPMRSAATWKGSTSGCRSLSWRSVPLILPVIKCFCAACLDLQCRCIKCTTCKRAATMTGSNPFDASCLFGYTDGQVFTISKERSSETFLRIDQEENSGYASILKIILRGYTLTKWT